MKPEGGSASGSPSSRMAIHPTERPGAPPSIFSSTTLVSVAGATQCRPMSRRHASRRLYAESVSPASQGADWPSCKSTPDDVGRAQYRRFGWKGLIGDWPRSCRSRPDHGASANGICPMRRPSSVAPTTTALFDMPQVAPENDPAHAARQTPQGSRSGGSELVAPEGRSRRERLRVESHRPGCHERRRGASRRVGRIRTSARSAEADRRTARSGSPTSPTATRSGALNSQPARRTAHRRSSRCSHRAILDVGQPAHRLDQDIALDDRAAIELKRSDRPVGRSADPRHDLAKVKLNAPLLVMGLNRGAEIGAEGADHRRRERLDDRHVTPELSRRGRKLAADEPAADDDDLGLASARLQRNRIRHGPQDVTSLKLLVGPQPPRPQAGRHHQAIKRERWCHRREQPGGRRRGAHDRSGRVASRRYPRSGEHETRSRRRDRRRQAVRHPRAIGSRSACLDSGGRL